MNVIILLGKKLGIYLSAVLTTYVLASVTASQHVVNRLDSMGVDVGFGDRLSMTMSDLAGMAGMFLPITAFGLLVAFMFTALLCRWLGRWRTLLYVLAGAAALWAMHTTMHLAFGVTPVAIARTPVGLMIQCVAGAVGGFVYISLNNLLFSRNPFQITE